MNQETRFLRHQYKQTVIQHNLLSFSLGVGRSDAPGPSFLYAHAHAPGTESNTFICLAKLKTLLQPLQVATSLKRKYIRLQKRLYISLHFATFRYIFFTFYNLCYIFATI